MWDAKCEGKCITIYVIIKHKPVVVLPLHIWTKCYVYPVNLCYWPLGYSCRWMCCTTNSFPTFEAKVCKQKSQGWSHLTHMISKKKSMISCNCEGILAITFSLVTRCPLESEWYQCNTIFSRSHSPTRLMNSMSRKHFIIYGGSSRP